MENKYKAFMNAVKNIESNRVRKNCLSLVGTAQTYYSYLKWYEKLKSINHSLSAYADNNRNKISVTDNYIMLMCYEYVKKDMKSTVTFGFAHFLREFVHSETRKTERNGKSEYHLFREYPELKNIKYEKLIKRAILKFNRLTKSSDFDSDYGATRHENLETAVNTYLENQHVTILDEETAFNSIYSEKFVLDVINMIEEQSPVLEIMIAPVRRVLSSKEGKNNRHQDCFDIKINKSYVELKSSCNGTVKKYLKSINNIYILNRWFEELESEL